MSNASDLLKPFYRRYACKAFDPSKIVSDEDFHTILEAGRLSPSSFGLEPWKFLVVKSQSLKDALFPLCTGGQASLSGASHYVIFLARKKLDLSPEAPYITHMLYDIHHIPKEGAEMRRAYYAHFQSDLFQLKTEDQVFEWACKQTYIALGNMLTVAASLDIDSCPIEGYDREKVNALLIEKDIFDPAHFGVSLMAGFGYALGAPKHEKTRQPLEDIVEYI